MKSLDAAHDAIESTRAMLAKVLGENTPLIPPDSYKPRLKVWAKIHENSDIVSYEKWQEITASAGYDPRGTGGFFTGNEPSVMWVGEDKVALVKWAAQEVEKYSEWLKSQK